MAIPSTPVVVDAELVHNYSQRYSHLPYFQALGADSRAALLRAHVRHHREGLNATELAADLCKQFPAVFTLRTYC